VPPVPGKVNLSGGKPMTIAVGQVYQCKICGNKVKVLVAGGGVLVCCGVSMKLTEDHQ
jgi:desulfoferrodoxin-like iron-binding protein